MPILNRDILHDIFLESSINHINLRSLANFMMAGKETFKIALNYFGQAISVKVDKNMIIINLPNSCGKVKKYKISYNFILLKPILAAVGSSIEELEVHDYPRMVQRSYVIDYLVQKGLKKVSLFKKLPEQYNILLKQSRLESISLKSDVFGTFNQLTMVPYLCRCLHIENLFTNDVLNKSTKNKITFPQVKELVIVEAHMRQLDINKLKKFISSISVTFPALVSFNVNFGLGHHRWFTINESLFQLHPNVFKKLSSNVKGKISILALCVNGLFQIAINEVQGNPNITVHQETKCIKKNFEIHNGLSFTSSLYLDDQYAMALLI